MAHGKMGRTRMIVARRLLLLVALSTTTLPLSAAEEWLRLATPHFELYTFSGDKGTGEKKGREALLCLESVRTFIMQIMQTTPAAWDQVIPVRLVSFQSGKQLKPYAPGNAGAYSANSQSRDYVVMVDSDPDRLPIAIHHYTHLALQHLGLRLPTWLNEGLAALFSPVKPVGADAITGATLGAVMKGYVDDLKSAKWLDFNTLTTVTESSASYNESNRTGQFYAESWALVHMLVLGRDYRENFAKMLIALNDGKPAADAWQIAYSRTPAQVYADLQAYVKQNSLAAGALPVESGLKPVTGVPVSDLESGVMLADLLAATDRREEAKAAYDKLANKYQAAAGPLPTELVESLGYLAWQTGDTQSARRDFEEALPGTKNPLMCYHLAILYHDAGQGGDKLLTALGKAVALKPDYAEARLQLGIEQFNRSNYTGAIAALAPIERIAPEHAATLYAVLANAYAQTGDWAAARKTLAIERPWMKTALERQRADQLMQFLDSKQGTEQ